MYSEEMLNTMDKMLNKPPAEKKKPKVKQYVHFVNCIREECEESICGKCGRGRYEKPLVINELEEFPSNGKCMYPFFDLYDIDLDALGAYETEEVK